MDGHGGRQAGAVNPAVRGYAFADFELDLARQELRRGASVVRLEPKAFALLTCLVEGRDRLVTKQELLDTVWRDVTVSEAVLPNAVSAIRKALGQRRAGDGPIKTQHGRGYCFTLPTRVLAPAPVDAPWQPAAACSFVGRRHEMARLVAAWERARTGEATTCVLTGEAGIGKTRTAEELASRVQRSGGLVLRGPCSEQGGVPALWPFIQIVRSAREREPGATVPRELELLLDGSGEDDLAERRVDADAARFQLYDAIARMIAALAARDPLLLILDDLQWADRGSIELLSFLLTTSQQAQLLVLATTRDAAAGHLASLWRAPRCEPIALGRLGTEEVAGILHHATGEVPPAELAEAVHGKTGGNPFFVTESVRLLMHGQRPAQLPDGTLALQVPGAVHDVIARRLQQVDGETHTILEAASILGTDFELAALAQLLDVEPTALLAPIDQALGQRLLEHAETPGRYAFAHVLYRDTLHDGLSTTRRVELHGRARQVFERLRAAGQDVATDVLAHHAHGALPSDALGAFRWLMDAGREAARASAHGQSRMRYGQALSALQYVDACAPEQEARRLTALLRLGRSQYLAGEDGAATATLESAIELSERQGARESFARALLVRRLCDGESRDRDLGQLRRALQLLPPDERKLRARLLSCIARDDLALVGEERAQLREQIVALCAGTTDAATLRICLDNLQSPFDLASFERLTARAQELAQGGDDDFGYMAQMSRYRACLLRGDLRGMERAGREAERLAERARSPVMRWQCQMLRITRLIADGAFHDAGQAINHLYGDSPARSQRRRRLTYQHQFLELTRACGRLHELGAGVDDAVEQFTRSAARSFGMARLRGHIALVQLALGRGDEGAARERLRQMLDDGPERLRLDPAYPALLADIAELCVGLGTRDDMEWLWGELLPFAELNAVAAGMYYRGSVEHFLGLLASGLGDLERAIGCFERALEMNQGLGARPALARTRAELAIALARRGDSPARVESLHRHARCVAQRLDLQDLLERLAALPA